MMTITLCVLVWFTASAVLLAWMAFAGWVHDWAAASDVGGVLRSVRWTAPALSGPLGSEPPFQHQRGPGEAT